MRSSMIYIIVTLSALVAMLVAVVLGLLFHIRRTRREEQLMREREGRLRRAIDCAPVLFWTARPDATVDFLNRTCVDFIGLPMQKLLDEGWLDTLHPDDRQHAIDVFVPATAAGESFVLEYRLRRHDGEYRWMLDTGIPCTADGAVTGYVGCCIDVTALRMAEDMVNQSQAVLESKHREVQQLAGWLITAHEDERRHLARELHDDVTQRLARMAIDVSWIERSDNAHAGALAALRGDLVRMSEDVHALSYHLHPAVLDDLGLVEALRTECGRVTRLAQLHIDVAARDIPESLPPEISLCLFRIAQEALNNVARHADASAVTVLLSPSGEGMQLSISDNGEGFDLEQPRNHPSLGLASMRERVRVLSGELDIKSTPGYGTTIVAWVPT